MYERGEGVPQSYSEAAKWYRLAAAAGEVGAAAAREARRLVDKWKAAR
jgi:TPR repeat protein